MSEHTARQTTVLKVDPLVPEPDAIARAADVLCAGGLVAFPTETVYGLGGNALDQLAVRGIYAAKQRDPSDPCIVHVASANDLPRVARVTSRAVARLAAACWPGPLSLVLPKSDAVPDVVTAGQPTVAVRVPDHAVALALIRAAGVPVAAPSANLFMHTSPTTAEHVLDDLNGRIDLLLDGGPTRVGVESTILDLTRTPPVLLRPGGVALELLRELLDEVAVRTPNGAPGIIAPGMMAKHYAPRARVELVEEPRTAALAQIAARARELTQNGEHVGLLLPAGELEDLSLPGLERFSLGNAEDLEAVAQSLYAGLRRLDALGVDVILARALGEDGLARAILDRLTRAAGVGR